MIQFIYSVQHSIDNIRQYLGWDLPKITDAIASQDENSVRDVFANMDVHISCLGRRIITANGYSGSIPFIDLIRRHHIGIGDEGSGASKDPHHYLGGSDIERYIWDREWELRGVVLDRTYEVLASPSIKMLKYALLILVDSFEKSNSFDSVMRDIVPLRPTGGEVEGPDMLKAKDQPTDYKDYLGPTHG